MGLITLTDVNGDFFEAEVDDIQDFLEAVGYGVVILPDPVKFFCFWSGNREILKKGHEIREQFEKEKVECGYVLHG